MTSEDEKKITTFKTFHVLILGCLLSTLLILNSNYVNEKRATLKLNEEKSKLFDEIIAGRHLQGQNSPFDKVCDKGSEDLVKYYKTGDLEKIGLDDGPIKAEKESYVTALINIIKTYTGEDDSGDSEGDVTSSGPSGTLRNLQSLDAVQDDLVNYVKHLLPILAFFVIAILAIPGWIICCFCCCCNCCCCCCCKKPGCKLPCFIFTNVFYALVVAICIYGLSQSNNVLKGMANTECSILKFFEQFLDGETKKTLPRWSGINEIKAILQDLAFQVSDLKQNTKTDLTNQYSNIETKRNAFKTKMETIGNSFFVSSSGTVTDTYKADYIKNFVTSDTFHHYNPNFDYKVQGNYVLDLVKNFGKYNKDTDIASPDTSLLYGWQQEYKAVSDVADTQLENAKNGFDQVLDDSSGDIINKLNSGEQTLDSLKGTFDDIKSSIADVIVDNYETIDDNGKLGFKIVFGVLGLINIALAAFMFLICFFSGQLCAKSCCCCRCIFKCAVHLLWNILALLMIITFLVGFLVALIGQIGSDAMSVISYVLSVDNIGPNGDNILFDNIGGDVKKYLHRCVNIGGNIEKELGLNMNDLDSLEKIYEAEEVLKQARKDFQEVRNTKLAYNNYKTEIEKRKTLHSVPNLISIDDPRASDVIEIVNYEELLKEINKELESNSKTEKWIINDNSIKECEAGTTGDTLPYEANTFNPNKCQPYNRDWLMTSTESALALAKNRANILKEIMALVNHANEEQTTITVEDNRNSLLALLNILERSYDTYLGQYDTTLEKYNEAIDKITGKIKKYTGNDGLFSFIKCSFIGTNLKIILKYLKSALGGDVKTLGICLLVVGCSLILSISATILMIVIINIDIENKKKNNNGQVPLDSQGRLIQYK